MTLFLWILATSAVAWPKFNFISHSFDGLRCSDSDAFLAKKQQDMNHLLWKLYNHYHHFEDLRGNAESSDPANVSAYSYVGEDLLTLHDQHHWPSLFNTHQREEAEGIGNVDLKSSVYMMNLNDFTFIVNLKSDNDHDVFANFRLHLCPEWENNGDQFDNNNGQW